MFLIEILKAVLYGIVEGITEWLPVSSTGHLILVEEFVKFRDQNTDFTSMFNVVIQLGAILAVVVMYFDKLNPFKKGKNAKQIRKTWQLWAKVLIAALPAAIIGIPLDDWFDTNFHHFLPVAIMLITYGVAFIILEKREASRQPAITELERLPYKTALFIGLFQVLSLFPGTSRSGATIVGGLLNGTSRSVVTEFTFYLGIPVMFGASFLKIAKFLVNGNSFSFSQISILMVAMLVAFGVSLVAIRFLTDYVKKHDFTIFGKYRIALGFVILVYYAWTLFR
ncbi:Undecaprenyl-diphosphatase [Streptococcus sp. DD10]|uniref:undecaprenyl-diphosphate phosphatase n=1 Tax=Streptococcus sp. DD10 TaxID=1777878 RepID=UPI00079BBEBD|nr:undecaprenyl-diphosphate phosphatase [Streptococcus sp. DD10]KXT73874.1 Undecaprenyl-diphosphatase [Streptococcus sp. DD10]